MKASSRLSLLVVAASLLTVLAAEWMHAAQVMATSPSVQTAVSKGSAAPAKPTGEPVRLAERVLARPLFSRTRRPAAAAAHQATNGVDGLPRLSGIIVSESDRRAIFAGNKPLVGRAGDSVGAYRILAIRPTSVVMQGQAGIETLHVDFGSKLGTPVPTGPNLIDRLNYGPRPTMALPNRLTLPQLLARLPKPPP